MKYNFIETDSIKSDFLKRHKIDLNKYSNFDFKINEPAIDVFYNKLLENRDSKFLIVGDYDCDGVCSVTIIKKLFTSLKINHSYYIPSRINEGYGLNKLIIDKAIKNNYDVILLVDNGVSCCEEIEYAYKNNIKIFIIDHHNYNELPKCESIIHQNLLSADFNYASAGELCFLLSLKYCYDDYNLILGALTIISDYILFNSFNWFLVKRMYEILNNHKFMPLVLLNDSNLFNNHSVTFNIIPKINSISRLEDEHLNPNHLVRFLLELYDDIDCISNYISSLNNKRKKETSDIYDEIIKNSNLDNDYIFICSEDINEGYCSSLSTRLSNYYNKTVFVFSLKDGLAKGSGRSSNLDIYSLIKDYNNYLSFGGHSHAIGLSIKENDLDNFMSFLNTLDFKIHDDIKQDVYLINPFIINDQLLDDIKSLEPFGNGYDKPLIAFLNDDYSTTILKDKYTKFFINEYISCITFDEKFLGYKPKYIIGYIEHNNYLKYGYSMIIKDLF